MGATPPVAGSRRDDLPQTSFSRGQVRVRWPDQAVSQLTESRKGAFMRRALITAVAAIVCLLPAAPAGAAQPPGGGWIPAPQVAYEQPAGARCDFAVRSEPIVDEVRKLVLDVHPDGSP